MCVGYASAVGMMLLDEVADLGAQADTQQLGFNYCKSEATSHNPFCKGGCQSTFTKAAVSYSYKYNSAREDTVGTIT